MTKKVGRDDLKKLIESVLSEKVNIDLTGKTSASAIKKALGLPANAGGDLAKSRLTDLIGLDNNPTNLTDTDLQTAAGGNTQQKKTAASWYDKTTDSSVDRNTYASLSDYINSLSQPPSGPGGGGGTLYFYADSSKQNLKQGLHSKNDATKGKKDAIAAEMKKILNRQGITNQELSDMLAEAAAIFNNNFGTGTLNKAVQKVQQRIGQQPPGSPASDALKTALKDIATALTTAEPENISAPPMVDVGTEQAQFPPGVITPLNDLFAGKNTYQARLQAISDISKDLIVNTANIKTKYAGNPRELLRDILIVDYFSTMFREIDDRAAAYYFEAFGALIGGGKVEGASGAAGDFTVAVDQGQPQTAGSSKFVGASASSSQAVSGFIPGVDVLYLTAKKSGASQKDRVELPIEAFTITLNKAPTYKQYKKNSGAAAQLDFSVFPASEKTKVQVNSAEAKNAQNNAHGGQASISSGDEYFSFTFPAGIKGEQFVLHLAANPQQIETLKELLDDEFKNATGNVEKKLQDAYQGMRDYFENLKQSQAALRDYIGDPSPAAKAKGSKALNTLATADDKLETTVKSLGGTITTSGTGTRTVTESKKITANFLKKLIQEKFKK